MPYNLLLFYVFGALAIATSLMVVVQSNPVYSVLLLIGSFLALAGLYVLLAAPFAAVIQIIVYAGAIMVLFLFVVMLLNAPREQAVKARMAESGGARLVGGLLAVAFVAELVWAIRRSEVTPAIDAVADRARVWSIAQIGQVIFRDYAFAFEATSVLILVAMVGAIAIAGRQAEKKPSDSL